MLLDVIPALTGSTRIETGATSHMHLESLACSGSYGEDVVQRRVAFSRLPRAQAAASVSIPHLPRVAAEKPPQPGTMMRNAFGARMLAA